jgi:ABC-type nitrate/sulfonate/bicarbonate transport system substrate-binding protein
MYTRCFSAILLALLALAPSLRAQETHLVAYAGFAGFQAPVWAPKDLGLFTKYGFNGDVVLVPGSVRQIQAIVGGSIHFAQADAATAVNAINQGLDLVMISGTLNSFPYSFVTQKEIRKPEDLTGKKIGILAVGGAVETATFLALKAWNIPRQSVRSFPLEIQPPVSSPCPPRPSMAPCSLIPISTRLSAWACTSSPR